MINPYYFTDRNLKVRFKINLSSYHINQSSSKITTTQNYPDFDIEVLYTNKIMKKLSTIYARLTNQFKFKYQTVFSARLDKQNEDNQVIDETELFINLNVNHNLTQTEIDKIDVRSPLKNQLQQKEMKDCGWRFHKIISMTVCFYKTGELNGSKFVETLSRSNPILNIEKNDDVHRFNELNNLSINIFELNFYQDQNNWRHKLIPVEVSKKIQIKLLNSQKPLYSS